MLQLGQRVLVELQNGAFLRGPLAAVGAYELVLGDAREAPVVIPLHAIAYWARQQ